MKTKNKLASLLLELGCVKFSAQKPFVYASGLKGPIYCDNRKLLSHVEARDLVVLMLKEKTLELMQKGLKVDAIAGLATAGIPHAALLADRLRFPMLYIRSSAKEHGAKNQIEGDYQKGMRLLLVEDLVNQASSLEKALSAVLSAELEASTCLCIVNYDMPKAKEFLLKSGLNLISLVSFQELIDAAKEDQGKNRIVDEKDIELLLEWQRDPVLWSQKFSRAE